MILAGMGFGLNMAMLFHTYMNQVLLLCVQLEFSPFINDIFMSFSRTFANCLCKIGLYVQGPFIYNVCDINKCIQPHQRVATTC